MLKASSVAPGLGHYRDTDQLRLSSLPRKKSEKLFPKVQSELNELPSLVSLWF